MQLIIKNNEVVAHHDNAQDVASLYPGCSIVYVADGVRVMGETGPRALADILVDSSESGAALAELAVLDIKLPRAVEDLVDAGAVAESGLPTIMQERLARKRELRGAL